jgi:serine/threonine protein kinase
MTAARPAGAFGKVRMGTHRLTTTKVAIKQLPKLMDATLTREIHHHRELHHPHVVQLYEIIATESSIWLVTELCSGGELFDYLVEKGRLTEEETRIIFGQLCLAVAYVHNKGPPRRALPRQALRLRLHARVRAGRLPQLRLRHHVLLRAGDDPGAKVPWAWYVFLTTASALC